MSMMPPGGMPPMDIRAMAAAAARAEAMEAERPSIDEQRRASALNFSIASFTQHPNGQVPSDADIVQRAQAIYNFLAGPQSQESINPPANVTQPTNVQPNVQQNVGQSGGNPGSHPILGG